MSTDVPLVPPSPFRPPLTLLVLLHAIFQALRGILESGTNPVMAMAVGELLHAGYLPAARAALDAHAARALAHPTGPLPREVAALALVSAIKAVETLGAEAPPRRFHARVALNGQSQSRYAREDRREATTPRSFEDLGLCLVEEMRLGGADALRCTQLCESPLAVHWIRAQSIYQITEVSDEEARDVVDAWQREREAERRQAEARLARYRALREECDVTVQRRGQFVCVRATLGDAPKPTRLTDGGGHEAMRKAGFDSAPLYDGAPWVGQRAGYLSRDDAEQAARDGSPLVEALRGLGFASVTVLPPVDANDEDARDFRFEDDASDHEGALA